MGQHDMLGLPIVRTAEIAADRRVGKMSVSAHQSFLQAPGIGSRPEHVEIVIRLQDQNVTPLHPIRYMIGNPAQIGQLSHLDSLVAH